jgi:hypothetical protein
MSWAVGGEIRLNNVQAMQNGYGMKGPFSRSGGYIAGKDVMGLSHKHQENACDFKM